MQKTRILKKNNIFLFIQICLFLSFCVLSLGMVFTNGICCGDDAYHAIIAKNLANGLGYTSTIQDSRSDFQVIKFDSHASVGPIIILPTALLIKIFGNTYWTPGLSIVIIWMICLFLIWHKLNKWIIDKAALTIMVAWFLILSYVLTAYHFEQWYALLGEVPAALLTILAILIYFDKDQKQNKILTGLVFYLACQSKLIVMIPFAIFIAFINLELLITLKQSLKQKSRELFQSNFLIIMGFVIPALLFVGWKLISLGGAEFKAYIGEFLYFLNEKGVGVIQISSTLFVERITILVERFGIFLPIVLVLLIGICIVLRREEILSRISVLLTIIVFVYSIYWIFFSIGWARYFFICLILIIFVLILPLIASNFGWKTKSIHTLILVSLSFYAIKQIDISYPLKNQLFQPSQYTLSVREMVSTFSERMNEAPFVTEWWATAADMEYFLPSYYNFRTYKDSYFDFSKAYTVVANRKFILTNDLDFVEFLKLCDIEETDQFIYGNCNQALGK